MEAPSLIRIKKDVILSFWIRKKAKANKDQKKELKFFSPIPCLQTYDVLNEWHFNLLYS